MRRRAAERGLSSVEYAILLALIAIALIAAFRGFGASLFDQSTRAERALRELETVQVRETRAATAADMPDLVASNVRTEATRAALTSTEGEVVAQAPAALSDVDADPQPVAAANDALVAADPSTIPVAPDVISDQPPNAYERQTVVERVNGQEFRWHFASASAYEVGPDGQRIAPAERFMLASNDPAAAQALQTTGDTNYVYSQCRWSGQSAAVCADAAVTITPDEADRRFPGPSDPLVTFARDTVLGVGDGIWAVWDGSARALEYVVTEAPFQLWDAVTHPRETGAAIGAFATQTWNTVSGAAVQFWNDPRGTTLAVWNAGTGLVQSFWQAPWRDKVAMAVQLIPLSRAKTLVEFIRPRPFHVEIAPRPGCLIGGRCMNPGQCFAAGTLVWSSRGLVPIESIAAGDAVWADDPRDQAPAAYARVVQTMRHERRHVRVVGLRTDELEDAIVVTDEHPFFTPAGFRAAKELGPGTEIVLAGGGTAEVVANIDEGREATVFNLEVETAHTYFVGTEGALVHNDCSPLTMLANERFGHVFSRHIGKSEEALRSRLLREPNLDRASSFYNQHIAEAAVRGALRENEARIAAWLAGSTDARLTLTSNYGRNVGMVVERGGGVSQATGVFVVLERNPAAPGGFHFVTAYPTP